MNQLKEQYNKEIVPQLRQEFSLANNFEVPRLSKIVINSGLGLALTDAKIHDLATAALAKICGQKPVKTKARKSIAGFKLRKGLAIGQKVTLRGERMYDFFQKLVQVALPRLRDFRGISEASVDSSGNLSIGFPEHTVFPEVNLEEVERPIPMEATIVLKDCKSRELAIALYKKFGVPFSKE